MYDKTSNQFPIGIVREGLHDPQRLFAMELSDTRWGVLGTRLLLFIWSLLVCNNDDNIKQRYQVHNIRLQLQ